jgi:hypothetical protein
MFFVVVVVVVVFVIDNFLLLLVKCLDVLLDKCNLSVCVGLLTH